MTSPGSPMQLSTQMPDSATENQNLAAIRADIGDSSAAASAAASDTENGERPVREKLKKTSIAALPHDDGVSLETDAVDGRGSDSQEEDTGPDNGQPEAHNDESGDRGRLRRKRSVEDMEQGEDQDERMESRQGRHTRKRSRDVGLGQSDLEAGWPRSAGPSSIQEDEGEWPSGKAHREILSGRAKTPPARIESTEGTGKERVVSPKNKRSLDEFAEDEHAEIMSPSEGERAERAAADVEGSTGTDVPSKRSMDEERKTKRHRDSSSPLPAEEILMSDQKKEKDPSSGTILNASGVPLSDASSGTKSSSGQVQTSASAFAASGFSALASSAKSPFATLSNSSSGPSPFAAFGSKQEAGPDNERSLRPISNTGTNLKASTDGEQKLSFASLGGSAFGGGASGFGKLGAASIGGFGALSGTKLTSFASAGPAIFGFDDKPAKPFGASPDKDDGEESGQDEDATEAKQAEVEDNHKDTRFFEQDVETGEEDETTVFASRAKLYNFVRVGDDKKEWKERGLGTLRLNVRKSTDEGIEEGQPKKARFVMRAEGSHRVVLNSPVNKDLKVGDPKGEAPAGGTIYFWGSIDAKPQLELLQLKMKQGFARELFDKVKELQEQM